MRKVTWMMPVGLVLASMAVPVAGFGQQGADPAEQYYDCIRLNEMRMLNAMVNSKGVKIRDKHAATPLHYAAAYGSMEAFRTILSAQPDVNAQNDFGATPLMWAITEPEKVRLLVAAGADVNAKSKMGRTALYLAAANDGSAATVRLLLNHGAKVEPDVLVAAAFANDLASIRMLLERGAPMKEKDRLGRTPLMLAAGNGNLKAVELLLAKGADVNAVSPEKSDTVKNGAIALGNLTALMLAAPTGGLEVTKALLDAGAKVNVQDVRRMTPLMLAVATDHADPRTVRLLLQKGAEVDIKDSTGLTAADWAKKYNSPAILRELGISRQKGREGDQGARVIIPASILGKLDPRPAAARSIALLQQGSGSFFKEGGCGSCHAQNLTAMALNAAVAHQIPVNAEARAAESKGAQLAFAGFVQPLLQRGDPPVVDILLYAGFQMASDNVAPDQTTDAMVHNIVAQQHAGGNWREGGLARPPMAGRRFLAHRDGDSGSAGVRSRGS